MNGSQVFTHLHIIVSVVVMLAGFYTVMTHGNLFKKMLGLAVFQTSVLLLYISFGVVKGGKPPIFEEGVTLYMNPLPHVLMLTAIVVGVATLAVGLAMIVRIKESYGTIEEDEIMAEDRLQDKHTKARLDELS